jgi:dipeptidyl aminopeptidase/acylaminoacyl peptidase
MLIHGEQDALIPVEQAYELREFALAAGNRDVELWVVPLANHVGAIGALREEYVRRVAAFFDEHLAGRQ